MNRRLHSLVPLLLLLVLVSLPAMAQVDKGSIEAVALDQSGAALPGVTVTAPWSDSVNSAKPHACTTASATVM